eukprot:gnl/Dysnectes_brevis/4914_a6827_658.p2 GENE.gnl/Dysnectes_brevis/4914_a6827_658~~gnl/Dysnectes_brevis/4914_a6827_658.p2  ORF type:complete len:159 (+),score=53.79 gnl/Dysnectes_brevis/4914_a6827_658:459-935(+)
MPDLTTAVKSILFVCWGNICRSPLAHGIFLHKLKEHSTDIFVDSCGTGGHAEDTPIHRGAQRQLKLHGIKFQHRSRDFHLQDYSRFDLILCMDEHNRSDVMHELGRKGDPAGKVRMFREWDPAGMGEVPDPYFEGGFDGVYDCVERTAEGLLQHILGM